MLEPRQPDPTPQLLNPMLVMMPPLVQRAYQDYLDMGATRSVTALWVRYRQAFQNGNAMVASLNQDELARWEVQYRWRDLAIEYDNAAHEVWQLQRGNTLMELYGRKLRIGKVMQSKAYRALLRIKPETLRSGDIANFIDMGTKLEESAAEKMLAMNNPKAKPGSAGDNYAEIRQMVENTLQMQIEQANIQINVNHPPSS